MLERRKRRQKFSVTQGVEQEACVREPRRRRYRGERKENCPNPSFSYEQIQATRIFSWEPIEVVQRFDQTDQINDPKEHFPPRHQQEDWENGYPIGQY